MQAAPDGDLAAFHESDPQGCPQKLGMAGGQWLADEPQCARDAHRYATDFPKLEMVSPDQR